MRRFNVVLPREDGGVEVHPLKEWLRQHPEHVPPGLDPTSNTSHHLRNSLRKRGWLVQETPSEVRLIPPGELPEESKLDEVLGSDAESEEEEDRETAFALEYQLRDFLAQNISAIDVSGRKLQVFVDPTGRDGVEYATPVGPIDILATDDTGAFFVFELKRARGPDRAMGQLMRYMGWVRQTIGKDKEVNGVIVAKVITDNLRYAASVVPNVSLFEYEVEFHLHTANELRGHETLPYN